MGVVTVATPSSFYTVMVRNNGQFYTKLCLECVRIKVLSGFSATECSAQSSSNRFPASIAFVQLVESNWGMRLWELQLPAVTSSSLLMSAWHHSESSQCVLWTNILSRLPVCISKEEAVCLLLSWSCSRASLICMITWVSSPIGGLCLGVSLTVFIFQHIVVHNKLCFKGISGLNLDKCFGQSLREKQD